MGIGIAGVIGKSIGKALRDVGLTALSAAGVAAVTVASNPEVLAPLVAVIPGVGGMLLLAFVPIAAKAAIDALKHLDKA